MTDAFTPSDDFSAQFDSLLAWRRDVRRFKTDPLEPGLLEGLIDRACLAPSVGNAQPWRFVSVEDGELRAFVAASFAKENATAAKAYADDQAKLYSELKLAGLKEAPAHLAVFSEDDTERGAGLGRQTMPETLVYSTICAIHTLWLAARSRGVGVGWVSILAPDDVAKALKVPESWQFVGYLCLGYPIENHDDPELVRHGWQDRIERSDVFFRR
jgi:5,6-dimethylbenzimidazole synthase